MKNSNLDLNTWLTVKSQLSGIICIIALLIWLISGFSSTVVYTVIIGGFILGLFSFLSMVGGGLAIGGGGIIFALIGNLWASCLLTFLFFGIDISQSTGKWVLGIFITWEIITMLGSFGKRI
jgi:hypothetical protein